ncbi:MAG: hypothetical protein M1510_10325 [Nitrospirae bacterium]|nr:hypothetical protein [Nitrospirota bacterium]
MANKKPDLNGLSILALEDDPRSLGAIEQALRAFGAQVFSNVLKLLLWDL